MPGKNAGPSGTLSDAKTVDYSGTPVEVKIAP